MEVVYPAMPSLLIDKMIEIFWTTPLWLPTRFFRCQIESKEVEYDFI